MSRSVGATSPTEPGAEHGDVESEAHPDREAPSPEPTRDPTHIGAILAPLREICERRDGAALARLLGGWGRR